MVRVKVTVLPAVAVELDTLTKDCDRERLPMLTVIVGEALVTALPPMVDVIEVAVPEVVAVKVAV